MAWFEDLQACTYFRGDCAHLLAVGWLEQGRPFLRGRCTPEFTARLEQLMKGPWTPEDFMGPHFCDLCPPRTVTGHTNLFVPAEEAVYVAPELVTHYIARHGYRPPDQFIRAVMACPPMHSPEYLAAVLRHYRPPER